MVAPERDRSGASNSLTLDRPLTVRRAPNGYFSVNGTPTDCVHIAVTGLLDFTPDLVVSGINLGANMGDDTIYSGTVAAAAEGYLLGIPVARGLAHQQGRASTSRAPSASRSRWSSACARAPFGEPVLLNVNVPDVAPARLRGIEVTRLGKRHKAEPVIKLQTPRGETRVLDRPGRRRRRRRARAPTSTRWRTAASRSRRCAWTSRTGSSAARAPASGWRMRTRAICAGIGMTSQRTRARMVERLREQGHPRRARARARWRRCRATCSSRKRSPAAPTRTRRCRSASARPSRSPTSWRG